MNVGATPSPDQGHHGDGHDIKSPERRYEQGTSVCADHDQGKPAGAINAYSWIV
jgi:hypothetical protein